MPNHLPPLLDMMSSTYIAYFSVPAHPDTYSWRTEGHDARDYRAKQHPLRPKPATRYDPHDAANALLPVPWLQGGSDDRGKAWYSFRGVWRRGPGHRCHDLASRLQDLKREPDGHQLREEVANCQTVLT